MSRESMRIEIEELRANQNTVVDTKASNKKIKELQNEVKKLTTLVASYDAAEKAENKAREAAQAEAKV